MFNVEKIKNDCVEWIRDFFENNGKGCNAVVGISGGKDSSVVAALCVEALGKDRVIGVLMPCGEQHDIDCAFALVNHLGIKHYVVNVKAAIDGLKAALPAELELTSQSVNNIPPRVRMTTLYAISQSCNGRVANTCNLSEDWVGYSTRYGDSVGDFSPLSRLTVAEVKQIGHLLGLPAELVEKGSFDVSEFSKHTHLRGRRLSLALKLLCDIGIVGRERKGKKYIYHLKNKNVEKH